MYSVDAGIQTKNEENKIAQTGQAHPTPDSQTPIPPPTIRYLNNVHLLRRGYNAHQANGSKSPQSLFESCPVVPPPPPQAGCAGLLGVSKSPIPIVGGLAAANGGELIPMPIPMPLPVVGGEVVIFEGDMTGEPIPPIPFIFTFVPFVVFVLNELERP